MKRPKFESSIARLLFVLPSGDLEILKLHFMWGGHLPVEGIFDELLFMLLGDLCGGGSDKLF